MKKLNLQSIKKNIKKYLYFEQEFIDEDHPKLIDENTEL